MLLHNVLDDFGYVFLKKSTVCVLARQKISTKSFCLYQIHAVFTLLMYSDIFTLAAVSY